VELGQVSHDRKAQPEPTALALQRLLLLHEQLEHVRSDIRRDPFSFVDHRDGDLSGVGGRFDPDRRPWRTVLGSIGQQVGDHLGHPVEVDLDVEAFRDVDREPMAARLEEWAAALDGVRDDRRDVGQLLVEGDLAARDPRDVEQVFHEARHVGSLTLDHVDLAEAHPFLPKHVHRRDDGGERVAQLVPEHGEELFFDARRRLVAASSTPAVGLA
jgi:hypothetical protein